MFFDNLLIAGRWYNGNNEEAQPILDWEAHHADLADCCVAIDPSVDLSNAMQKLQVAKPMAVQPWVGHQKWTAPLNALVAEAALQDKEFILFCSTGVRVSREALEAMITVMRNHPEVVVVGPLTDNHYFFEEGLHKISGISIPWNNTALWRVSEISKIGFQLVSDGLLDSGLHGVEEVVTLTLLWMLNNNTRAVLLEGLPGDYLWRHEEALGEKYLDWADEKLRSKKERPEGQLRLLGLPEPQMLYHIDWTTYRWLQYLPH